MDNNEILATNETYEAAVKVLERQERSLYPDVSSCSIWPSSKI